MKRTLKVIDFKKKQKLLDFVNMNSDKIEILSISTSQVSIDFTHFLWYYENN